MGLFGNRKDSDFSSQSVGASGDLKNQIISLQQQGYTNQQIIQYFQSQGYVASEIQNAMESLNSMPTGGPVNTMNNSYNNSNQQQPTQNTFSQSSQGYMPYPQEQKKDDNESNKENIEEIAESIIDEKWNDLVKDINKVIEWKEKLESRMSKVEQKLNDLENKFDSLHQGVLGKISDYDKNLSNVGTEIKSMQKVFKDLLPSLTENVSKLDRLVKKSPASNNNKKSDSN